MVQYCTRLCTLLQLITDRTFPTLIVTHTCTRARTERSGRRVLLIDPLVDQRESSHAFVIYFGCEKLIVSGWLL